MPLKLQKPITYLITSGGTTAATTPKSEEFLRLKKLVEAAVAAKVSLLQIREKNLSDRVLYELSLQAAEITSSSSTRLLVNDRADIARAAGADGVHLTTRSVRASVIRQTFGDEFLLGVSTHSPAEAREAQRGGADFAVYGPVFATESKRTYGDPLGLANLRDAIAMVDPFPLIALGGITVDNAPSCYRAGASGVAAIRLLNDPERLPHIVERLRESFWDGGNRRS